MKHRIKVTAEWIVNLDVDNGGTDYYYPPELKEHAIHSIINDIEDATLDAKWTADIMEESK